MTEDSSNAEKTEDPIANAFSVIQDELQRLRHENATLKQEVQSLHERVQSFEPCLCHLAKKEPSVVQVKPFIQPPPEILRRVFERTILPLSILDPSVCLSSESMWCQVFKQKQTLASVCKAWYDVALPFLYEHIHVRFIPQLTRLLETLWNTGKDHRQFVNSVSLYCVIPTSYAERFKDKLKLFFSLCPNAKAFYYLPPLPLPSPTFLKFLPAHVTYLRLCDTISYETLMNTLHATSTNLVSLSFVVPCMLPLDASLEFDVDLKFPNLETLSCELRDNRMSICNTTLGWSMPRMKKLTLLCDINSGGEVADFCLKHGCKLKFLNLAPSYTKDRWDSSIFAFRKIGEVLKLCPSLEHVVIHPRAFDFDYISHPTIKWVDIWETGNKDKEISEAWSKLRKSVNLTAYPSLQGVRELSPRLAYLPNLPIIFPPGQVSTPADWAQEKVRGTVRACVQGDRGNIAMRAKS